MRRYRTLGVAVTKYSRPAEPPTMPSTISIYRIRSLAARCASRARNVGDCAVPIRIHSRARGSRARTRGPTGSAGAEAAEDSSPGVSASVQARIAAATIIVHLLSVCGHEYLEGGCTAGSGTN